MRLISTSTLKLEDFKEKVLKYAILSHVWSTEEIIFSDFESQVDLSTKKGWRKLKSFCELACDLKYEYAWVDTCCIDKRSSADIDKSINSMYAWYEKADFCIAYLKDVVGTDTESLRRSIWFKRGWTLQELIAPETMAFYDTNWNFLGYKRDMLSLLCDITGIPEAVLNHDIPPRACSVAQRMSWAAGRETTEPEDRAYSLKGLFDVSLQVHYGNGAASAFLDLQQAIIRESSDESIFAWQTPTSDSVEWNSPFGMLAPTPDCFAGCGDLVPTKDNSPISYQNGILSMTIKARPYALETYLALLNVTAAGRQERVSIVLAMLSDEGSFVRLSDVKNKSRMECMSQTHKSIDVGVCQKPTASPPNFFQGFWLRRLEPSGFLQSHQVVILSKGACCFQERIEMVPDCFGTAGVVCMVPPEQDSARVDAYRWPERSWLKFGFDAYFKPVCIFASGPVENRPEISVRPHHLEQALSADLEANQRASLAIFEDSWLNEYSKYYPYSEGTWRDGYVIIKGDRVSGLDVSIAAIGLNIQVKKCPDQNPSSGTHSTSSAPTSVWIVDVGNIPGWEPKLYEEAFGEREMCFLDLCDCLTCGLTNGTGLLPSRTSLLPTPEEVRAKGPGLVYRGQHW